MALPDLNKARPTITIDIPREGQKDAKVKLRFMAVSEQKILLMTKEADNVEDTVDAMNDILTACRVSGADLKSLNPAERDYLFIQLVAASSGKDRNRVVYTCRNKVDGQECGNNMPVDIVFNDIEIAGDSRQTADFDVGAGWKITVARPEKKKAGNAINWAHECITMVWNTETEEVNKAGEDFDVEEAREFWDGIDESKDVITFLMSAPTLKMDLRHKCSKCGYDHDLRLRGLQSFF